MGKDLSNAEHVLEALQAAENRAKAAYASAVKLKGDMVASGVNPLTDADAFERLNDAFKTADAASDEAEQLRDRLARLQAIDGITAPRGTTLPVPAERGAQADSIFRLGARFTNSDPYRAVVKLAEDRGDAQFVEAMRHTNPFQGGVPVLARRELQAMLGGGRYGATAVTGSSSTSAGPFIPNDLQPGYIEYVRKTPTLAAVVGQAETDSDTVEYVTQSAPTNNAAPTAETNNAPESAYPFATATTSVQEIVHYVPITRRAMQDAGQMRSIIEGELVVDLLDKLDDQLASGLGTGDELEGIYTAVTVTQALSSDTRADAIHKAMTQIRIAAGVRMEPDWIGIHPNDYQDIVLETDANGRYILGDPNISGPRTIWGVPFLVSTVFTDGTPLVGNFARGARLWTRSGVEVLAGLNDDDFVKRRVSLMATGRWAFKTIRPAAFCEVTGF